MNRSVRLSLSALVVSAVALSSHDVDAQQQSLKEQLIGSWILVSNVVKRQDGVATEQFGPAPKGILIFAADGRFITLNARSDLPRLSSGNRARVTPDEAMAVAQGSLAYYGTYSVSEAEKMITVRIEGSTYANQIGTIQKRLITSITADKMTFTNPAATSGGALELVWKREK
jgi:hypothetical protein